MLHRIADARIVQVKTPVIIPAYQEASTIARTLDRLPSQLVEPTVIVNGEPDGTADIARDFGATVYESPDQGKMPALKYAFARMSGKQALKPLIILDADAYPILPSQWHNHMVAPIYNHDGPVGNGGPMFYSECSPHESLFRGSRRFGYAGAQTLGLKSGHIQYGPNMALKIDSSDILDAFMEFPNYWPGEDRAMADTIEENGGKYIQTVNPAALVVAPLSLSAVSLTERIKLGPVETRRVVTQRYVDSGPAGAVPYIKNSYS